MSAVWHADPVVHAARHMDALADDDAAHDAFSARCEAAREDVQDGRERAIVAALVKPGSNVSYLLHCLDCEVEASRDIDRIVRMAADPLSDPARIGHHFRTYVNALIGKAAEIGLDAAVTAYVGAGQDVDRMEDGL